MSQSTRKWTPAQSAAIEASGIDLLVSAAAGSGKTATLTERIIRSITRKDEPADISKMLIVTFTRAAANELKERIFLSLCAALANEPSSKHLNEQLIKLGSASISTIDSFYLNLIRSNFATLGISATARIADQSELDILKQEIMNDVIDKFYDSDDAFPSLAECFVGTRSINKLSEPMLVLFDELITHIEGVDFLKYKGEELLTYADGNIDFLSTVYGEVIRRELLEYFEYCNAFFDKAYEYSSELADIFGKRAMTYESDRAFTYSVFTALSDTECDFDTLRSLFLSFSPAKLGGTAKDNETPESIYFKEARGDIKNKIKDITSRIFSRDNETIHSEMRQTAANLFMIHRLLCDFSVRLDTEKTRRNVMDFNDIRKHTYRLLVDSEGNPTEVALKYRESFSDIYIDEYQDVDSIQDKIFSVLSRGNRFMVGDIKQSIYGFRGAEPQVFAGYRSAFPSLLPSEPTNGLKNAAIFMSDNFRCDKNVIDYTNAVCSRIFGVCKESIGYTAADDLRFSKKPPHEEYISPKVKVSVILTDKEDTEEDEKENERGATAAELEAEFIAERIASLVGKERNADGSLITPGDIAIIYRSSSMVSVLAEALGRRGILCSEGGGDYFESPEVLLTLSLLNTIDNPHRDIHLASALLSPIFEFTLDELIEIKLSASSGASLYDALLEYSEAENPLGEKCRRFDSALNSFRRSALSLTVDRFLRILFESEIFSASGLLSDRNNYGDGGNLLRLYEYARTFENGSFKGLYNFIEFINTLIANDKKLEVSSKDRCADRVNLTTMHHSKGLEFPVCFICGCGKRRNTRELAKSMVYDYPLGVTMRLSDTTGFAQMNTPMREALMMKKRSHGSEEEMRILYVAMTRARERLYITGTMKGEPEGILNSAKMKGLISTPYSIKSFSTFFDWLLPPFLFEHKSFCGELEFIENTVLSDGAVSTDAATNDNCEPDEALVSLLREKFAFEYPHKELLKLPAKISVSRLSPDILDESDNALDMFDTDKRTAVPDFFISGNVHKASGAERGTATHLFLQFCNFHRMAEYGVKSELERLIERQFIPKNIAELIYLEELDRFPDSELAKRILGARRIIREQRFNILMPAELFSEDKERARRLSGETLAVQGVIDLLLIDGEGNIELYDYKTDRLSSEELASPALGRYKMNKLHGLQLSYYARAVQELFGKECSRIAVYSTHSARLYDIDEVKLKIEAD